MQGRRMGDMDHVLVLARGEKVVETLLEYAARENLRGGWISGLGSLRGSTLGYYELADRTYIRRTFPGDMELTGLQGNLAMDGESRILHLHASLSGTDFVTYSGHLFEAEVAVLAEFHLRAFPEAMHRRMDDAVGLKALNPCWGPPA